MSDLIETVQKAQSYLLSVHSIMNNTYPGLSNPAWLNVQRVWLRKAKLHEDLVGTSGLFESRDAAMKYLEKLNGHMLKLDARPISDMIPFGTTEISMSAARLLSIDSYLAVTWSIYDRLSNVIGLLMGNEKTLDVYGSAQKPKLIGDLIAQVKGCYQGFGICELLPKLYSEEIHSSYYLRNSFMHDGGMLDNVPILSGSCAAACFELSRENAAMLNRVVAQRINGACTDLFKEGNIICQLKGCHNDLDKMFASLLEFVVRSFCSQVYLFCGRIGITPTASGMQ